MTVKEQKPKRRKVYPKNRRKAKRTKESYRANSPETLAKQKAGLARARLSSSPSRKQKPLSAVRAALSEKPLSAYADDPVGFIETHFFVIETRRPMVLLDHEKSLIDELFLRSVRPNLACIGMPKKTGKSTFAAAIALWFLITKPTSEIYLLASTSGQSQLVAFDKIIKSIRMNPFLLKQCRIKAERIEFEESFVQVLAPNQSVAGINPSLIVAEELWSWVTPEHRRSFDELTNVPTRTENLNLVTSYAGYAEDEGRILWDLYKKGVAQRDGKEDKDPRFLFKWFGIELYDEIPWVDEKYLPQQKKRLRENSFLRLHENKWASGEESFVDPAVLDACTNPDMQKGMDFSGPVTIGIDIGLKHDASAVVVVGLISDETLGVIDHRCYVPTEGRTLDLERTVETIMLAFASKYNITAAYYDPYQFARSAKTLENAGLPMQEYCQTQNNTVAMSTTLSGLLSNQNLMLYEDSELREHLLNARTRESQRGWRLVKKGKSKKIDLAIGLAMATQAAQEYLLLGKESYFSASDLS